MKETKLLTEKYPDLPGSKPVESAVAKKISRGEKGPGTKEGRIEAYLERLERLVLDSEKKQPKTHERKNQPQWLQGESRPRALSLLREMLMKKYVRPHKQKMAVGAAKVEERAARELGIEARYGERELEQRGEIAVEDLEKSLDQWILYLSDANEPYPTWFRYYAFRNILDLGDYDKDKNEFPKRAPGSFRVFPDIDRGALAYVEQMIEAADDPEMLERLQTAQKAAQTPKDQLVTREKAANFRKLSFAKQYAEGIEQAGEITPEMRAETRGKWVKYGAQTDPTALWASLQNKGVSWCTKGFATAETQLKGGDFYVYYTLDRQGKPTIPRVAIRMQGDHIGEVRGAADNAQNLEGNMAPIAEEKLKQLPGAEQYQKASEDMKLLTTIDNKTKANQPLTKDELVFLYEIDHPIQGFGYQTDPRIKEIRDERNPKEDAPVVIDCAPNEIAWNQNEINPKTKAYVGPLFPGIFQKLQHLDHIYTSFPEQKIRKIDLEIGGTTKEQLIQELKQQKINISDSARQMMVNKDFTTQKDKEQIKLIRLKVKDLFSDNQTHTTDEIYAKADELGLELCPPEVGPKLRLQYQDQPLGEWFYVGMKQITDAVGRPSVFLLGRGDDGLWLVDGWAIPRREWNPGRSFVFRSRK